MGKIAGRKFVFAAVPRREKKTCVDYSIPKKFWFHVRVNSIRLIILNYEMSDFRSFSFLIRFALYTNFFICYKSTFAFPSIFPQSTNHNAPPPTPGPPPKRSSPPAPHSTIRTLMGGNQPYTRQPQSLTSQHSGFLIKLYIQDNYQDLPERCLERKRRGGTKGGRRGEGESGDEGRRRCRERKGGAEYLKGFILPNIWRNVSHINK